MRFRLVSPVSRVVERVGMGFDQPFWMACEDLFFPEKTPILYRPPPVQITGSAVEHDQLVSKSLGCRRRTRKLRVDVKPSRKQVGVYRGL